MRTRRLHPVPLVAGLVVALVTAMLGNWQMRRAAEKVDVQHQIEAGASAAPVALNALPDTTEWRSVSVSGTWQSEATIFLDNRVYEGRPGYHVFTPMQLDGQSGWVLVNRGWAPMGADRNLLPQVPTATQPLAVSGSIRWPEPAPFTLAAEAGDGPLWQFIDLEPYRDWSGVPVRDWIVQQTSASDDGLIRDWPRPDSGIDRHRGYALQWYSFAGISLALTGFYVFRSFRSYAA